jgi:hypothetical protein
MNNNDLKRVGRWDKKDDLKGLRFENGDVIIPDVESYFVDDEESDEDD